MRLDKYLKVSRVIKRRTVANEACDNGRVQVNGKVAKAGTQVKPGDIVQVDFAGGSTKFEVLSVEENVKKSGAAEMYRILTSLALVFFICVSLLTSCAAPAAETSQHPEVTDMPQRQGIALSFGDFHIYDEQFCYFFSMAAHELSAGNYSGEWLEEHFDETLDRTLEICQEQAALHDEAIRQGFALTDVENTELIIYGTLKLEYNMILAAEENFVSTDELCLKLTGMNYSEYRRYLRMYQPGEKLCRKLVEAYHPSEEEQLAYYGAHAEDFAACSVGKIFISDDEKLLADQVLDLVRNQAYPFDIIARGWSEDENVLNDSGLMDLCVSDDTLPVDLKTWIRNNQGPITEENAVMMHIPGDGYYILINRGQVGLAESDVVRAQVLDAMDREMLTAYKKEIVQEKRYQIQGFDRERAVNLVVAFVEDRQK